MSDLVTGMPPNFPFVAGGYVEALRQLGHVDFLICCSPFYHRPAEPGGCPMCHRILTDMGVVEFISVSLAEIHTFEPSPSSSHHFSPAREPHLVADCDDACRPQSEHVAVPGKIGIRLPVQADPLCKGSAIPADATTAATLRPLRVWSTPARYSASGRYWWWECRLCGKSTKDLIPTAAIACDAAEHHLAIIHQPGEDAE